MAKEKAPQTPAEEYEVLGIAEDLGIIALRKPEIIKAESQNHETLRRANRRLAIEATMAGTACALAGVAVSYRRHRRLLLAA